MVDRERTHTITSHRQATVLASLAGRAGYWYAGVLVDGRESLRGRCDVLLSTVDQLEGCRLDCRLLEKYVSRSVPKWDEAVLACYSGDRPGEAVVD